MEDARAVEHAAVPMIRFALVAESSAPIRSLALNVRVLIAADRRRYDGPDQERLLEVFGPAHDWGRTLRSLLWTQTAINVPSFTGSARVDLPVTCTYEFEIATVKYLDGVADGDIPLEFLFSGTMFYSADGGSLRAAQIPWDTEARFAMPVQAWKDVVDRYFPDTAWLRLHRDTFHRLYAYKARNTLDSWERAIDTLLDERGAEQR